MDFGLFDRAALKNLKAFEERNHFIMGTIVWLGFRQARVSYHRMARHSGTSKRPLAKRIKTAIDALVSSSYLPPRLGSYIGLKVCSLSLLYALFLIIRRAAFGPGGKDGRL